ncbi:DUF1588 domain-containing protein [Rubinisphaera margarita]|uniref:DUF1588 domain-containing protein n=1 Tax=Rubinisphaera margarita TaxID=2909586 RepID=UPI001EE8C4DA|nr:DUF1588 domain-containing protein [Rubinisphaera margarita]MCG6158027.1 DUF1588 domain-containing protein [Rubinisphaera margarita]
MTRQEGARLQQFLQKQIVLFEERVEQPLETPPRRLNNREFENSIRDVLRLEHIGTHDPLAMLPGDTLYNGFDTHGESLGMSEFHLDQQVTAIRRVLDNVILSGEQPSSKQLTATADQMFVVDTGNRRRVDKTIRRDEGVELKDPADQVYCENFPHTESAGWYRITVKAKALDRHVYSQDETGIYDGDPLILRMELGSRHVDLPLVEGAMQEFTATHWLAENTSIRFSFQTDGLRLIGNGNFKFQHRIAHDYIETHNPDLYQRIVEQEIPNANVRSAQPNHWVHWVSYWQGPRPLLSRVEIEGPFYKSWPPQRQVALVGKQPKVANAAAILKPIAQRAWRREVSDEELAPILRLVESHSSSLGELGAIKEGIVAIFVSPSFLLLNSEDVTPEELFAVKLSYLLGSTTPDAELVTRVRKGELDSFEAVRDELKRRIANGKADEFLREFPYGWLELDRINFMSPDVDQYPLYEKKRLNEDMVNEVLALFRHVAENNRPLPELLSGDYSFVNADLAKVYGLEDVPSDSVLRKVTFRDGKRGGLLGAAAFLTLTADTLSTSPIHRAVFVMENLMGIHPSPPPADVEILEPDVRSARTIREVLEAHKSDATCAACHRNIDPFGYAFENFDPVGAWRDEYIAVSQTAEAVALPKKRRNREPSFEAIPIDASSTFVSGAQYKDITEFRQLMQSDSNRDRFVRCFVTKVLTYANGIEPENFTAVESIVEQSASHDYRSIETLAAIINSPLFRERKTPESGREK